MLLRPRFVLCDEEVSAEEPSAGGGAAETDQVLTVNTLEPSGGGDAEPDYSSIEAAFKKLSGQGDDHSAGSVSEESEEPKSKADDHSGDGDGEADAAEGGVEFGDDLLERARFLGVSDELLGTFESAAELERAVGLLGLRLLNDPGHVPSQPEAKQAEEPPAVSKAAEEKPSAAEVVEWVKQLKEEGDPVFSAMAEAFETLQAQVEELRGLQGNFVEEQSKTLTEFFDATVDGLDGDFLRGVYGQRETGKVDYAKRQELFERVVAVGGIEGLKNRALVKQMAIALNHDEFQKDLRRQLQTSVKSNASRRLIPKGTPRVAPKDAGGSEEYPAHLGERFRQLQESH